MIQLQNLLRLCMSEAISGAMPLFPVCLHSVHKNFTLTIHTPQHMTFLPLSRRKQKALPKYRELPEPDYAGVSKSYRTEMITRHMLTFVMGHCCPLQSTSVMRSGNRSGTSATAGNTVKTDFFFFATACSMVSD
jgi:hypothetical protein